MGPRSLIADNVFDNIANDSIDIITGDITIRRNQIREGRHNSQVQLHADGIQGWTLNGATNENVSIDSNSIVNLNPDPNNYMQGITIFDGKWKNVSIVNNLVVTNHWHGISVYGVDGAAIVNNTVIPASDKFSTWILVHEGKDKSRSTNTIVRNNLANDIVVDADNSHVDHNIARNKIDIRQGAGVEQG